MKKGYAGRACPPKLARSLGERRRIGRSVVIGLAFALLAAPGFAATKAIRAGKLIDPAGKVAKVFVGVKPGGHSEEVLSALAALQLGSQTD